MSTKLRKLWIAGGRYFIRLALVNPAMRERVERHVREGWLVHDRNEGDVSVFKVTPNAPFAVRNQTRDERWMVLAVQEAVSLLVRGHLQHYLDLAEDIAEHAKTHGKNSAWYATLMGEIEGKALARGADPLVADQLKMAMRERREKQTGSVLVLPSPTAH